MSKEKIRCLLKQFVERNSNVTGIQWDPEMYPKLLIKPYSKDYEERRRTAHYFLLVASVDESRVIGRAENARALLIHLHKRFRDKLFNISRAEKFEKEVRNCRFYNDFGPEKGCISRILSSVNKFVSERAGGDLINYARKFRKPKKMVEEISRNVKRMGGPWKEKAWMYMKWMVRPKPDLGIFKNFSPRDLFIPLTIEITNVAACLGLMEKVDSRWWKNEEQVEQTRERVTAYAKELFPEDPLKVDYPFFMLGRWLRGKDLSRQLLEEYLRFFDELYKLTGTTPVKYNIASRVKSGLEEKVRRELKKAKILFYYESEIFNLPGGITYKADFILRRQKVEGKTVILEPHGTWEEDGEKAAFKYALFRETFGKYYYLILLVPERYFRFVRDTYKDSYDDIFEISNVPDLLFLLKKNIYHPLERTYK